MATNASVPQALRIRRAYVKSILKQDVGWFDEHPAGQLPTAVTTNISKMQDGLGRKIGDIVSNALAGAYTMFALTDDFSYPKLFNQ